MTSVDSRVPSALAAAGPVAVAPSRVLVVDADVGTAQRMADTLTANGFQAVLAHSPEQALFEYGAHDIDAVIASLSLPGMGTTELCRELRRRGPVPVVVTCAEVAAHWMDALDAGADEHVGLSCDDRELVARLRALIRRYWGTLTPTRTMRLGDVTVRYDTTAELVVDGDIALAPVESTLLAFLAAHRGFVVRSAVLADRVRAEHGPVAAAEIERRLRRLRAALIAAGAPRSTLHHLPDGWLLTG